MSVAASEIITRVRSQLIDENVTKRWSDAELLRWLSDGQRTIVALDPSLGEVTSVIQLDEGTKQTLPQDTVILLDIRRNMGTDGVTPGRAIRVATREAMDNNNPNWHSGLRSSVTQTYTYDPQQPKTFFVYPPSTGTNHVEVSRSAVPAELSAVTDNISVSDLYRTALVDYVMYRAHQKDSDYAAGEGKAAAYLNTFVLSITGHETAKLLNSANMQLAMPDLTVKGAAK